MAGTVSSLHDHTSPHSLGCRALFLSQRKNIISYILFLFPSHLISFKRRNWYYRPCARLAPFKAFSTSFNLILKIFKPFPHLFEACLTTLFFFGLTVAGRIQNHIHLKEKSKNLNYPRLQQVSPKLGLKLSSMKSSDFQSNKNDNRNDVHRFYTALSIDRCQASYETGIFTMISFYK